LHGAVAMAHVDSDEIPGTQRKKHRHDLGQEDHGPKLAAKTTRGIQTLLGLWIALTLVLVVYAIVDASRPRAPTPQPAPAAEVR
jgi:hypothetical protein